MAKRRTKLRLLVSANHKNFILIYDNKNKQYDIWFNNELKKSIKENKPTEDIVNSLLTTKNDFNKNIESHPIFIKQIQETINDIKIEEKTNEFYLRDSLSELLNSKHQKDRFNDLDNEIKLYYYNGKQLNEETEQCELINSDIFITKNVNGFYLMYIKYFDYYILLDSRNNSLSKNKYEIGENPNGLFDIIENTINEHPNYKINDLNHKGLQKILSDLENDKITLHELFADLTEVLDDTEKRNQNINDVNNDILEVLTYESEQILLNDVEYKNAIIDKLIFEIKTHFDERENKTLEIGRRKLADLLTLKYGVILRKYIGTIYKENKNGYEPTSHDDLIIELTNDFGVNYIHDTDLKKAIGYISKRLEPTPNIIKFENTLFDMGKLEPYEPKHPVFTVLNIPYNYNPNAKSTLFKNFLYSSFERNTEEETEKAVKGIKQLTGYFLTSGNSLEILPILTGLTGAGKSTYLNILTGIIGKDKISGISLQSLEKDIHASSGFIGKHLNIIRDSDTTKIKNVSILKSWTGNESYPVNPKFKDLFDLPADEVPKPILACNIMPEFAVYDDAVIRRFVIVEFKVSMTKKGTAIKDLDKKILENAEEVEWFIYESIQEYKRMIENNETFVFKITDEKTKELIEKHTHPINYIIHDLILKHDPEAYDEEKTNDILNEFRPIYTDDLVNAILFISNRDGIDVPVNKHGKIDKRKLLEIIRDEYDLHDGEIVKHKESGRFVVHRDYTTRSERFNGLNKKAYPNLIATKEYIDILNEIEKQKTENK